MTRFFADVFFTVLVLAVLAVREVRSPAPVVVG
jgi:hypothetical protein